MKITIIFKGMERTPNKTYQTPPSKEKEGSSFLEENAPQRPQNLIENPQRKDFKRIVNDRIMRNMVKTEDLVINKRLDESISIETKNLRQENDSLKEKVHSLSSENKLLKETNLQLNNHIEELKATQTKLLKKYQEKKEYTRKLLEIIKIQSNFPFSLQISC